MNIGIGISTFNRPNALKVCLESIQEHIPGHDVYVSDDGSEPDNWQNAINICDTHGAIMDQEPNENQGVAANENRLLRMLDSYDYIMMLMDDALVISPQLIQAHITAINQTGINIFACPHEGDRGGIKDHIGLVMIQNSTSGPMIFMTAQVISTIGGYDSRMRRMHWDDIDFMNRAIRAGFGSKWSGNNVLPGTPSLENIDDLIQNQGVTDCVPMDTKQEWASENRSVFNISVSECDEGNFYREYREVEG